MPEQQEWQTHFKVEPRRKDEAHPVYGSLSFETWVVINVISGDVVGEYRDYGYARRQARRRYKKLIRFMEKNFMSRDQ